jgi:replicative DNA helicase
MVGLTDRSEPVDLVTLKDELARSNELDEVGGPAYISALTDGVPRSANVEYYAKIVKEKSTLRRLIQSATEVLGRAYEAGRTPTSCSIRPSDRSFRSPSTGCAPASSS